MGRDCVEGMYFIKGAKSDAISSNLCEKSLDPPGSCLKLGEWKRLFGNGKVVLKWKRNWLFPVFSTVTDLRKALHRRIAGASSRPIAPGCPLHYEPNTSEMFAIARSTGRRRSLSLQERWSALICPSFGFAFYLHCSLSAGCPSAWTNGFQVVIYINISLYLYPYLCLYSSISPSISMSVSMSVSISIYKYFLVLSFVTLDHILLVQVQESLMYYFSLQRPILLVANLVFLTVLTWLLLRCWILE